MRLPDYKQAAKNVYGIDMTAGPKDLCYRMGLDENHRCYHEFGYIGRPTYRILDSVIQDKVFEFQSKNFRYPTLEELYKIVVIESQYVDFEEVKPEQKLIP